MGWHSRMGWCYSIQRAAALLVFSALLFFYPHFIVSWAVRSTQEGQLRITVLIDLHAHAFYSFREPDESATVSEAPEAAEDGQDRTPEEA